VKHKHVLSCHLASLFDNAANDKSWRGDDKEELVVAMAAEMAAVSCSSEK